MNQRQQRPAQHQQPQNRPDGLVLYICNHYIHLFWQCVSLFSIGTCIITWCLYFCTLKLINEWLTSHWDI
jgi:hypothetical protein